MLNETFFGDFLNIVLCFYKKATFFRNLKLDIVPYFPSSVLNDDRFSLLKRDRFLAGLTA